MAMIFARRIPSPLAGAADCGPNQQWDPNYVVPGLPPGQCTPKGSPMTAAPGVFEKFMSSIFPKPVASAPTPMMTPMVIQPTGMSQTTMITLGLGAVGILAIAMFASRK